MTKCICGRNAYDRDTGTCVWCGHGDAKDIHAGFATTTPKPRALDPAPPPPSPPPAPPRPSGPPTWTRDLVLIAIRVWAAQHDGKPPRGLEWSKGTRLYPAKKTVERIFADEGGWKAAIRAAGFTPPAQGRPRKLAA